MLIATLQNTVSQSDGAATAPGEKEVVVWAQILENFGRRNKRMPFVGWSNHWHCISVSDMGTATYRVLQQTVSIVIVANGGNRTFVLENLIWKLTGTNRCTYVYESVLWRGRKGVTNTAQLLHTVMCVFWFHHHHLYHIVQFSEGKTQHHVMWNWSNTHSFIYKNTQGLLPISVSFARIVRNNNNNNNNNNKHKRIEKLK
jgi:hypothetical protein